jgi:UDP-N-acetylmuramoyl-tripeptide--D-alanyl-D-alanine ligase
MIGAELSGPDREVGPDVCIDSRSVSPGALFVALPGDRVDGAQFVGPAAAAGAGGALVAHPQQVPDAIAQLVVPDPLAGLTRLAGALVDEALASTDLVSVALTGSSGKTSTKDLLAQVLAQAGPTVATQGNHNNEIGVPLTACGLGADTRYLLCEMGARAAGDLTRLTAITKPSVAGVLNVGSAHLGEFGSPEAIAAAKSEIVQGLPTEGFAILNADQPLVSAMAAKTAASPVWFSVNGTLPRGTRLGTRATDLHADALGRYGFTLQLVTDSGTLARPVQLQLVGAHQVANAAAAAAFALAVGVPAEAIVGALNSASRQSWGRMELHRLQGGAVLINDAYNANPESMRAALKAVGDMAAGRAASGASGQVTAVLGDMLELGPDSARIHREIGGFAAANGVDEVLAIGQFAHDLAAGARDAGAAASVVTAEQAADRVLDSRPGIVLVKASRGLGLESVVTAVLNVCSQEN